MGYITTDFWANYPQIWLEPMYILVTAWNDKPPGANRLRDENGDPSPPIFSIGTQSAFWSPFWQTFYVEVPAGTPSTKYTSTRQLFDDHLVMHPGPNRFASIAPNGLSLPSAEDISSAITDLAPTVAAYLTVGIDALADVVNSSKPDAGWLDGVLVPFFDFGTDNFEANADREIQDVPLFLFEKYDADGVLKPLGVSNVGGVAPLFSHVPGRVSASNRPQFGALWRLHIVTLPTNARTFTTGRRECRDYGPGTGDQRPTWTPWSVAWRSTPVASTIWRRWASRPAPGSTRSARSRTTWGRRRSSAPICSRRVHS